MNGEPGGLSASLRRLGSTLIGIAQTRIELLSTELEEERARLTLVLLHAYLMLAFLSVGISLATLTFAILWWEKSPAVAVGVPAVIFCGAGIWSMLRVRTLLREKPKLFAATVDELAKDRAALS